MTLCESFRSAREFVEGPTEHKWSDNLLVVLMADDDPDDYLLVKNAFEAGPIMVDLRWVSDGEEAMDYLLQRGKYADSDSSPRPDLLLLDLIMPRKDGLETLKEIKGNHKLRKIPGVLLTASRRQEHEASGLKLGADSFIVKPHNFDQMVQIMSNLHEHYFGIIRLPDPEVIENVRSGERSRNSFSRRFFRFH